MLALTAKIKVCKIAQTKYFTGENFAIYSSFVSPYVSNVIGFQFLLTSLYGDEREASFWSLALYYLLREKHRMEDPKYNVRFKYLVHHIRNVSCTVITHVL